MESDTRAVAVLEGEVSWPLLYAEVDRAYRRSELGLKWRASPEHTFWLEFHRPFVGLYEQYRSWESVLAELKEMWRQVEDMAEEVALARACHAACELLPPDQPPVKFPIGVEGEP